ncbi:hypothetical protein CFC21_110299 [Triticum aestivum]|uniref:Uncharacterized protein n=2 Tax=Triticum aestivum TaxID=4565 RepID=A0A3B6TV97_WHEAT|nr:hypothetical protein CFC21_110299 [Triticum aestivum]
MSGRSLGFLPRHRSASLAASRAVASGYRPPSRGSMMVLKLSPPGGCWRTHPSSFCSSAGRLRSTDRRPVRISYSTTPNPHTSLFTVRCPVSM